MPYPLQISARESYPPPPSSGNWLAYRHAWVIRCRFPASDWSRYSWPLSPGAAYPNDFRFPLRSHRLSERISIWTRLHFSSFLLIFLSYMLGSCLSSFFPFFPTVPTVFSFLLVSSLYSLSELEFRIFQPTHSSRKLGSATKDWWKRRCVVKRRSNVLRWMNIQALLRSTEMQFWNHDNQAWWANYKRYGGNNVMILPVVDFVINW